MSDWASEDISGFAAVVGMAVRVPGAATPEAFWENLVRGADTITRFAPDTTTGHIPAFGVMDGAASFDASFFGYSPREALMLDPQHRVFLECAWEALEHAGYDPTRTGGSVGVYGGSGDTGHSSALQANRNAFPGISTWELRLAGGADFLTSRVAYKLGLNGPAVTVQTACSTSLVAVHMAVQGLLSGECDTALAGGVTAHARPPVDDLNGVGVLSRDGVCRVFDAAATGTVASDGAGIVVLRRLEDALRDGDEIYAVIRGSAVNNDGAAKAGFTAPSVTGQVGAITTALMVAGTPADTIGYIEAHGTGTPVGDPIEVRALAKAFGTTAGGCVLGSAKGNIGHTDAASGVVGLIKAVLALHHEVIPGTAHFREPNADLSLSRTPFTVTSQPTPWRRGRQPRRAAVNSLGIGGTNAHVVLEEAPVRTRESTGRAYHVLPVSARSSTALHAAAGRLAKALPDSTAALEDIAWTLQTGRTALPHRGFVVASDRTQASARFTSTGPKFPHHHHRDQPRPVAFLFSGQGGQYVGMGRDLYLDEPVFRDSVRQCAELAEAALGLDLREVLYPCNGEPARELDSMLVSQAAVFTVQYALASMWRSWGIVPDVVLGHSLGAYAAATVAGVFDMPSALHLVMTRGRILDSLPDGQMLAVPLSEHHLTPMLNNGVSIAAINAPDQCVLTGTSPAIAVAQETLACRGVDARLLHITAAAHSALVEPAMPDYAASVAGMDLSPPVCRLISDHFGRLITPEEASNPDYWVSHLRHTVRFDQALRSLFSLGDHALLEIGPGHTLTTLAKRHPRCGATRPVLPSLPHAIDGGGGGTTTMTALGMLWLHGSPVDWTAVHEGRPGLRVALPTYPFERRLFDLTASHTQVSAPEVRPVDYPRPDLGAVHAAPVGQVESAVAAAFAAALGLEEVGRHDNFFDLGGDSLIASQYCRLVRMATGVDVAVREIFTAPTVAQLTEVIAAGAIAAEDSPPAPGKWALTRGRPAGDAVRMYCFPHSGGSPGDYMRWADRLDGVAVWGIQVPGKGGRAKEPPFTSLDKLVDAVVANVDFTQPFVLFGHSLGAVIAYETAQALAERELPTPLALLVSGMAPPHLLQPRPSLSALNGAELLAEIERTYGKVPVEISEDAELRDMLLAGLRADLDLLTGYEHRPRRPLSCPITVFGGTEDDESPDELAAWQEYTTGTCTVRMLPGDHFYFKESSDDFFPLLGSVIANASAGAVHRASPLADAP
ncbi:type I polyketide synthase [Streptomyces virginiae]|uniref:type I polyketide synthase n=1 Tax=Streptomyces virginiae TaxID=1961 RepID=UPI00069E640C|nr:type I polyketide synthase [Streptomyces virginiae]